MVERQVGQASVIDELMPAPRQTMLDRLAAGLDWQPIQTLLGPRTQGPGAPGYPPLVLLRALMLGLWYDLSDPALEAAIADRLSFRRFCGLSLTDPVPDHSTLWRFRAALAEDGRIDQVFAEITRQLEAKGLILKQGTLIDASLVPARPAAHAQARSGRGRDPAQAGRGCARALGPQGTQERVRLQDPHRR